MSTWLLCWEPTAPTDHYQKILYSWQANIMTSTCFLLLTSLMFWWFSASGDAKTIYASVSMPHSFLQDSSISWISVIIQWDGLRLTNSCDFLKFVLIGSYYLHKKAWLYHFDNRQDECVTIVFHVGWGKLNMLCILYICLHHAHCKRISCLYSQEKLINFLNKNIFDHHLVLHRKQA